MLSGHGSAWRRRRNSRAARIAVPLAIPMALGLTLGIVLAVSGVITSPSAGPVSQSVACLAARATAYHGVISAPSFCPSPAT